MPQVTQMTEISVFLRLVFLLLVFIKKSSASGSSGSSDSSVYSGVGFDLSSPVSSSQVSCLLTEQKAGYLIIRSFRNVNLVDTNAATTIRYASLTLDSYSSFDMKQVNIYMFPCVSNAPYSISNNITCSSPKQQVRDTLTYLQQHNIVLDSLNLENLNLKSKSFSEKENLNQDQDQDNIVIGGKVWIDIEDEVPSKYYSPNVQDNQDMLKEMVDFLRSLNLEVGLYSTSTYWKNIMDDIVGYGQYDLWYPRYDSTNDFTFFESFADFDSVTIKQTMGNVGVCGISQVDSDWAQ